MNKKKELEIVPTPCFLWTSLGLNQGPPDYESYLRILHEMPC